jgi:hypothetical protein
MRSLINLLLLVLTLFANMAGRCTSGAPTRFTLMSRSVVTSIMASELRDVRVTSSTACVTLCLMEPTCCYITLNDVTMTCILYAPGLTVYDVTHLKTFTAVANQVSVFLFS